MVAAGSVSLAVNRLATKKARGPYRSARSSNRGPGMPIVVERTELEPHAGMHMTTIGVYLCLILDHNQKFSRFRLVKKERQINASINYVCHNHP